MGAAYFIVLNQQDPGFDTTLDGKALSRHSRQIDAIAMKHGFKSLDEYCSQSLEEARLQMADLMELEDEIDLPAEAEDTLKNMPPEEWHDADHGLDYANKVADHVRQNPTSVKNPDAVLYDLDTMITVLTDAASRGLKWHFQVDF